MRRQHGPEQLLQLSAGSVLGGGDADSGLHDVLGQVQLAGQRTLLHDAVRQRAHPLEERAAEGSAHHDPQHAGFLVHIQAHAPAARGQHAAVARPQGKGGFFVDQVQISAFHSQPKPVFHGAQVLDTVLQHGGTGSGNVYAAGSGQRIRHMGALHQHGGHVHIRFILE